MWHGDVRRRLSVAASFVWRCLNSVTMVPFPHPAHRTEHADLLHSALGQDFMPLPTAGGVHASEGTPALIAGTGICEDNICYPPCASCASCTATGATARRCRHLSSGTLC